MARITYRTRLQALIDNPAVGQRDRTFCESLLGYYNRSGKLSAGRVTWVKNLEDRYTPENLASNAAKGAGMLDRLNAVCERTGRSSWARGFINSLQSQIMAGRALSERQTETLAKIETEHNDEAMTGRAAFVAEYSNNKDNMRDNARLAAAYYKRTGYFQSLATKILDEDDFIPQFSEYNKMVKNKYAQKILAAHYAPAKYAPGSVVKLRSGSSRLLRTQTGDRPCIVIQADAAPVTTAAKGTKVYSVLPVGRAEMVLVEERDIMIDRSVNAKNRKKKGSQSD